MKNTEFHIDLRNHRGLRLRYQQILNFIQVNAKNKTVPHGKWSAFRRDNGRLDWRPVTLQTPCGQIGRAVAECPSLQDKPFYIDRSAGAAGFKFGDVARMKCPNKILEGTDKSHFYMSEVHCVTGLTKLVLVLNLVDCQKTSTSAFYWFFWAHYTYYSCGIPVRARKN